jgi:hypothetical protein
MIKFAGYLQSALACAAITLVLLVVEGGSPLTAFGADPYVSGPLSISNIRMYKQARNGGWTLANELQRNDRYRLTLDVVNRTTTTTSGGDGSPFATDLRILHHIRINMKANQCYRAFTDQTFRTRWNPTGTIRAWNIPPVNPDLRLRAGQSTQAHLYFRWNCATENAMMMNPGLVPRVLAMAEFDAQFGFGGSYQSEAYLLPNQKVGTRYAIGGNCANNRQCVSRRCDAGDGTTKTNRCIPNNGGGREGDYCTHPNHCGNGFKCKFSSPKARERACLR